MFLFSDRYGIGTHTCITVGSEVDGYLATDAPGCAYHEGDLFGGGGGGCHVYFESCTRKNKKKTIKGVMFW